jgi:hypothetical protein
MADTRETKKAHGGLRALLGLVEVDGLDIEIVTLEVVGDSEVAKVGLEVGIRGLDGLLHLRREIPERDDAARASVHLRLYQEEGEAVVAGVGPDGVDTTGREAAFGVAAAVLAHQ